MDLQLAYLATPQNAAQASAAAAAPAAAQNAAQTQFAAKLTEREETIEESDKSQNAKIRPDADGGGNGGGYTPDGRREYKQQDTQEFTGGEHHVIDFTA